MMARHLCAGVLLTLALVGCGGAVPRGSFSPQGYRDAGFDLRIVPATSTGMPMSDKWLLDSHYQKSGDWIPKTGRDWEVEYGFDYDAITIGGVTGASIPGDVDAAIRGAAAAEGSASADDSDAPPASPRESISAPSSIPQ